MSSSTTGAVRRRNTAGSRLALSPRRAAFIPTSSTRISSFPRARRLPSPRRRVGARLVLTAHGRDVRNVGAIPGVATATAAAIRRADAVIAVSDFLRGELEAKIPDAQGKVHVIDSGVDLARFRHRDPAPLRARARVGAARARTTSASERWTSGRTSFGSRMHLPGWTPGASSSPATVRCVTQLEGRDACPTRSAACRTSASRT